MGMAHEKDPISEETVENLGEIAQGFISCGSQLLSSGHQIKHLQGPVPSVNAVVNTKIPHIQDFPLWQSWTDMPAEVETWGVLQYSFPRPPSRTVEAPGGCRTCGLAGEKVNARDQYGPERESTVHRGKTWVQTLPFTLASNLRDPCKSPNHSEPRGPRSLHCAVGIRKRLVRGG